MKYLFSWDKIPGRDNVILIEFLKQNFGIDWIKTAKIEKIEDGRTIKVSTEKNSLLLRLNDEKTKVSLKIDDVRTDKFIAKTENSKLNIYEIQGKYSRFIPSIFKEAKNQASFMEQYFKIFEHILTGINDDELEESDVDRLDIIGCLFHPRFAFLFDKGEKAFLPRIEEENKRFRSFFSADMDDFLVWFAGWMGLVLKENWDIQTKREIIAKIIPLYRIRGTKRGLEEYLKIFTRTDVIIFEEVESFRVGVSSHVGKNTILGGLPPNYFIVNINLPESDTENQRKRKIIEEMINAEKPAHTSFRLNLRGVKG